jgi:hypothetical protein
MESPPVTKQFATPRSTSLRRQRPPPRAGESAIPAAEVFERIQDIGFVPGIASVLGKRLFDIAKQHGRRPVFTSAARYDDRTARHALAVYPGPVTPADATPLSQETAATGPATETDVVGDETAFVQYWFLMLPLVLWLIALVNVPSFQ